MPTQTAPVSAAEIPLSVKAMRSHMDRLRGRLFQQVESVGLPEKQEEAFKGLIRRLTYDAQADLESALKGIDR